LVYAMTQELATFLAYRNLRQRLQERDDDPALNKLLRLVFVDERAHYDFFREGVEIFLKYDREETLEQMRRVMHNFAMPAINERAGGRRGVPAVNPLEIMSEEIYYRDVYPPTLAELNVDRAEMRNRLPIRKSAPTS